MFSKCQLIKIPQLSGPKGSVYTILIDDEQISPFQKFVSRYKISFKSEINDIVSRLKVMGFKRGMNEGYFKLYEGNPGDGVCALYDKDKSNLRLYCIRYGSQLIILGGGAQKPKTIRTLQDDPDLKRENYILRDLSKLITEKMQDKEIQLSEDGLDFEGELTIEKLDYE
ncbi:hypothetical protein [Aequorivita capsosiphonis]|uniref:hypothetical protein n=1 Tax=Aequorivita capsosiphonis TaxID=487317 RepID=UPI0004264D66|nr:hypothetical protein [Aequorivita capsosiphonis]